MENVREITLDTLVASEREQELSHRLIRAVLDKYDYLGNREKAFIKRVTEGTIERRLELDYYLNAYASVPTHKMKPIIRNLLRMSVYQIRYMDGIPDSAVCNEACKLAGKRKFQNLKGFVNGVLRSISREKDRLPLPDKSEEPTLYYSVKYSMPTLLVELWLEEYGRDVTETMLESLLKVHPVSLRFRGGQEREPAAGVETTRGKVTKAQTAQASVAEAVEALRKQGVSLRQSPYSSHVYLAENAEGIRALPGFAEGLFTVQDVSSVLAVQAAGIRPGDTVVDMCAAPGGKSILAAETAGLVLAGDISEYKTDLIRENRDRMRSDNIQIRVHDATVFDSELEEQADVLLLDVPCSGLGVMGKKRDIKYHVTRESLESITDLQRRIIENSWRYVKPGGTLLYSTCTLHRKENQEMVKWILENFPFEEGDIAGYLPGRLLEEKERLEKQTGNTDVKKCSVQLLPGFMEADGFFFARLVRKIYG
ncbi:MAG: 16S rRNA (cytosine(967)-C(5))-methyltransferase RsmB [Roseburia sp.]|nr:16S rRNA (cytosine(967)-C(5))-methyltransferase RsmB [Roseburia sp.]